MASPVIRFIDNKEPAFKIGDIMTCIPTHAGCSHYPVFGVITAITKAGRFRINLLGKLYPPCEKNTHDVWGSRNLIKPDLTKVSTKESVLVKWDSKYPGTLFAGEKNSLFWWDMWDPVKEYFDVHDNGD